MTGRRCRFMPLAGEVQRVCWAGAALVLVLLAFWRLAVAQ